MNCNAPTGRYETLQFLNAVQQAAKTQSVAKLIIICERFARLWTASTRHSETLSKVQKEPAAKFKATTCECNAGLVTATFKQQLANAMQHW